MALLISFVKSAGIDFMTVYEELVLQPQLEVSFRKTQNYTVNSCCINEC